MSLTSGTTGQRKMAVHCHESLVANVQAISHPRHIGLTDKDVLLCTAMLGHSYALFGCVCKAIVQGASCVFLETTDTAGLLEALEKHKVSMLSTVPYVARGLLDHPERMKHDLGCLKYFMTSGSCITEDIGRRLFQELKLSNFIQQYGQTEALFVAAGLKDAPPRYGSSGRLGTGVEAMVTSFRPSGKIRATT
ncbi:hypothetical protein HPB48_000926 [Haemaphysalis longicornis]|uniref:AMP-dependent synthetase/ligase domain-containing protein n=1 Tax=Haemaphysalis longicornis TaxID=44386 RepID=A0A9J6G0H4_HAELO|nr:hypothetical protein HPB48_000926 [Haemaphysalis longicornis]